MSNTLSVLAGIIFVVGFVPYLRAVLKHETRPSKASWIVWWTIDAVTLAGMLAKNTVNGQIIGALAGASIVVVLALKYGKPGWTWLDKASLGGCALGIVLWKLFNDADFGIAVSMVVVFLGSFPTFASVWKNPANEDKTAWVIFFASGVCAVIAIPAWTIADALQPWVYFAGNCVIISLLFIKPWLLPKKAGIPTAP